MGVTSLLVSVTPTRSLASPEYPGRWLLWLRRSLRPPAGCVLEFDETRIEEALGRPIESNRTIWACII